MTTRTAVTTVVLTAALSVGCGDDAVTSSAPSSQPASGSSAPGPAPTSAPPFPADTRPDTAAASGGLLGMKVARAAAQPGFERVVLELDGDGAPGWNVSYVAEPISDGSGEKVDVKGSAFLQVIVTGVGYPADTGVPEPTRRRFSPATTLVKEVVLNGVYEGQYTVFIGLGSTEPFRVFRLSSPPRVVVDVRTS